LGTNIRNVTDLSQPIKLEQH